MSHLNDDCLFCKIIKGEIPSCKIFESNDVYAFPDISQVNPGHALMVPREHIVNLFDYNQGDAAKYLQYILMITNAIEKIDPKTSGMNIAANNGASADQVVMRLHIHFISRFEGDGFKVATRNNADQYTLKKYEEIANEARKEF